LYVFVIESVHIRTTNMKEDLQKMGLSHNAILVYLSLLKIGETSVGSIISDLKLHRQSIYNALEELEDRNMVFKNIKNKISHYKIMNPDILIENAKKQEIIAVRLAKTIKESMKKSRHEHEINVYDGREKIKRYIINKFRNFPAGETVHIINGYSGKFNDIIGNKFMDEEYEKLRTKRKIYSQHLANEKFRNEFGNHQKNKQLKQTRFLPYNLTHLSTTVIWPNCVNIQSFTDDPFIIEIKNEKLRISHLEQFKLLWSTAKK